MKKAEWPRGPTKWIVDDILHISIPFTWNLADVKYELRQQSLFWEKAIVGGPAVALYPDYFNDLSHVQVQKNYPGVLQRVNPLATKTTTGCVRKCKFCAVPKIEGKFRELDSWKNLPIICDNNLLAASMQHFHRVIDRLLDMWDWADFNQGLDIRLLNYKHAKRLAEIKKPVIRLALDSEMDMKKWLFKYEILREAGIAKSKIRSYALIAFDTGPSEAWDRCEWIESHGVMALPMWFHPLNSMKQNWVTPAQRKLGWTKKRQREIMGYYYKHRGKKCITTLR